MKRLHAWCSALAWALAAGQFAGCAAPPLKPPEASTTPAPAAALPAAPEAASGFREGLRSVRADRQMVAAAHPLAAEAGREMLRAGGGAVDAAVAMQLVLGLVEPQASGLGGGAFLMVWDGQRVHAIDGREAAPASADERLFLGDDGKPLAFRAAQIGGRSVGVPGAMRALELAHRRFGKLPWAQLFEPAIRVAEQGFEISPRLHVQIAAAAKGLAEDREAAAYFLTPEGAAKPVGSVLRNPAYAATLRAIAYEGARALHEGPIAADIIVKVRAHANAGRLDIADLRDYRAKEREPLCTDYRRWRVCGMPPPSSGGIAVAQMLGVLEPRELEALAPERGQPRPQAVHLLAEAGRLAFADRALYVADPDFVTVDVAGLVSRPYLAQRAALIGERSMGKAAAGSPRGEKLAFAPDRSPLRTATSQIVAVDANGHAVSMTTSIESQFGSHLMVRGFLLNNELTDFSFAPTEPASDGVTRPVANRAQPGKRPRSSMAPTLVFERGTGRLVAALGSPGGSQIIGYVAKTLVGVLDWQLDAQEALNLPNFGSRNGPTELEKGRIDPALAAVLRERGHEVAELEMTSGVQAIVRGKGGTGWVGAADPRRDGVALGD
ncbi:gamma-glutamyltransferase [Caldimonas sp. KR1-144]|uniref:gamma-glutamyltransferase n=1 Tax=Caldimonas sp. KR1-144 TaxID=3400911 RepID=UPI003C0B4A21